MFTLKVPFQLAFVNNHCNNNNNNNNNNMMCKAHAISLKVCIIKLTNPNS
jgi:hypothetical protein